MSGSNLFNDIDEDEDDLLFNDTPSKPDPIVDESTSTDSGHFNPGKAKESLFDLDDDDDDDINDSQALKQDVLDDDPLIFNDEEGNDKVPADQEEPLGFMNTNDHDEEDDGGQDEVKEQFEVIDPAEAPSVEEAEEQLEIVRQEIERRKKEQRIEEEEEEGEEGPDGALLSRAAGIFSPTSTEHTPQDTDEDVLLDTKGDSDSKDAVIEELQQQVSELTNNLQQTQSESAGLKSEVATLRRELDEKQEKINELEDIIKKKDAEIASLKKDTSSTPKSGVGSKPAPSSRKPSISTTTTNKLSTKQQAISSPKQSARLKQDIEKKSVAETVKKFGQPADTKKHSPSTKRGTLSKKDSAEKLTEPSRVPKQDSSAASRKKDLPTGSTSPTKPARAARATKTDSQTKSDASSSPMISSKPQRNTLDAIKMWEQKTGEKEEPAPPTKKPLTNVKSTPCVIQPQENGEENVPPPASTEELATDSSLEVDQEKEKELTEQKSPLRKGTKDTNRQMKTESMIVSGAKSKRWAAPTTDKCQVCKKSVYPTERLQADEKVYHKTCFRCTHCKKVVGLGTYAAIKGDIYCKTHFKMLFKMKGNYDEGFGREQHKKKWSKSALQEDVETATNTSED